MRRGNALNLGKSVRLGLQMTKKVEQTPLREKLTAIPVFQFNREKLKELRGRGFVQGQGSG